MLDVRAPGGDRQPRTESLPAAALALLGPSSSVRPPALDPSPTQGEFRTPLAGGPVLAAAEA